MICLLGFMCFVIGAMCAVLIANTPRIMRERDERIERRGREVDGR